MNNTDFQNKQKQAVEQMREMNSRATPQINPPPKPQPSPKPQNHSASPIGGLNLPFMDLLKEKDTALILGLLLILFSENADKRLLFALIYILL